MIKTNRYYFVYYDNNPCIIYCFRSNNNSKNLVWDCEQRNYDDKNRKQSELLYTEKWLLKHMITEIPEYFDFKEIKREYSCYFV